MHNALFQNVIMCTPNRFLTALLWYIELTFHKRISNRIRKKESTNQSKKRLIESIFGDINVSIYYDHHVRPALFSIPWQRSNIVFIRIYGILCHSCYNACLSFPSRWGGDWPWGSFYQVVAKMFYGVQVWRFWGSWQYSNVALSWKSTVALLYGVGHCLAEISPSVRNYLYTWYTSSSDCSSDCSIT
jgi:hypothetical protein